MTRPRPEQPSDPKPVEPGVEVSANDTAQRKPQRKRKRRPGESPDAEQEASTTSGDAAAESSPEPNPNKVPEEPERIRREVATELAFRERVALRELAERLPPETYQAVERALAGTSARWRLEKGRYLFIFLVGERTVSVDDQPVAVEQKLAIGRDEAPAEPAAIDRRISELIKPDAAVAENVRRLAALQSELAAGDEVRIRTAPERPEIVVTAEAVTEALPDGESVPESERVEPAALTPETVERIVAEVAGESETTPTPDYATIVRPETTGAEIEPPPESADAVDAEAAPTETIETVADVLDVLDREAVNLHDLPPMAGGAPEGDELNQTPFQRSEEREAGPDDEASPENPAAPPPEVAEQPPAARESDDPVPPKRPHRRPRPRRRRAERILAWEPGWVEAVRYPDHEMRKSARKMIRRLAAEYGLKLTPEMEAYLLGIVLKPRLIGGRRVYGLRLNMNTLISVLQVLKYNFNFTRPPRV